MKILNRPIDDYDIVNKKYVDEHSAEGDTLPIGAIVNYDGSTVPDGYEEVSEMSGSNSNGSWIKFADGTMICYGTITFYATFGQWGNLYGYDYLTPTDLPQTFMQIKAVTTTLNTSNSNYNAMINMCGYNNAQITKIGLVRPTVANTNYSVDYIAIGRWK